MGLNLGAALTAGANAFTAVQKSKKTRPGLAPRGDANLPTAANYTNQMDRDSDIAASFVSHPTVSVSTPDDAGARFVAVGSEVPVQVRNLDWDHMDRVHQMNAAGDDEGAASYLRSLDGE